MKYLFVALTFLISMPTFSLAAELYGVDPNSDNFCMHRGYYPHGPKSGSRENIFNLKCYANSDDLTAILALADKYSKGLGVEQNSLEVDRLVVKALTLGKHIDGDFLLTLGKIYFYGKDKSQTNIDKAIYWFQKSAALNYEPASLELIKIFFFGVGQPVNTKKGTALFHKGTTKNKRSFAFNLTKIYAKKVWRKFPYKDDFYLTQAAKLEKDLEASESKLPIYESYYNAAIYGAALAAKKLAEATRTNKLKPSHFQMSAIAWSQISEAFELPPYNESKLLTNDETSLEAITFISKAISRAL